MPAFVLSSVNVNRSFYWGELFIHPMKGAPPRPTPITQCDISGYHRWIYIFGYHHCITYFIYWLPWLMCPSMSLWTNQQTFVWWKIFREDQHFETYNLSVFVLIKDCTTPILSVFAGRKYLLRENMKVLRDAAPLRPTLLSSLIQSIWEVGDEQGLYRSFFFAALPNIFRGYHLSWYE